jgi:hypothetical protein
MKTTRECGTILANLRTRRRQAGTGPHPIAVKYSEGPMHFYRAYYLNGRIAVAVRDGAEHTDPEFLARVAASLSDPFQEVDALFLPWWLPCIHPQYTYARSFFGLLGMTLILMAIVLAWHYIPEQGLVYHWSIGLCVLLTIGIAMLIVTQIYRRFK